MRIAAAVLVALAPLAHADVREDARNAIERARALEAQLAYDEALAIIDAAIAAGQSDRDRLVELHLIAGRLNAGLDRAKAAEDHFAIVLALRPAVTLPEGTSPKIAVPFTVARTKTVALEVRLVVDAAQVAVEPVADPLGLVAGIAIGFRDGVREDTRIERAALRVARAPGQQILEVRALDRHGNVLWTGIPPAEAGPIRTPAQPGLLGRWTTWAALGGVALAAGGFAAWRFDAAQNEFDTRRAEGMTDFSELEAIADRGRRWGLAANISFGVAAATAITSVVLFVRRPRDEPAVTVTASPGAIGIAGRF